jgi:hypothetical protein
MKQIVVNSQYTRFQAVEGDRLSDSFKTGINNLAINIKNNGLINPITVKPYPKEKYTIIAGNRRYMACALLRWKEMPCIVQDVAADDFMIAFSENMQRVDITDPEKGEWINQAFEHLKGTDKFKDSKKPGEAVLNWLSSQLGISVRSLYAYRKMASGLSEGTKREIKAGRTKASIAAAKASKKRQSKKGKPVKKSISTVVTGTEKRFITLINPVIEKLNIVNANHAEFSSRKKFVTAFKKLDKAVQLTKRYIL